MSEAQVGSRRSPGRPRRVSSEDFPVRQPPEIDASDLDKDPADRTPEVIVADKELTRDMAGKDYLDDLAFAQEYVTIFLYRGNEEYAPDYYPFWVNGKRVDVAVEKPVRLRRMYVENIARCQPYKLRTKVVKPPDGSDQAIQNLWKREQVAAYPFEVIEDANPRGRAWLELIKRQSV